MYTKIAELKVLGTKVLGIINLATIVQIFLRLEDCMRIIRDLIRGTFKKIINWTK